MNKKKHFLLVMLVILICATMALTAFACDNKKTPTDEDDQTTASTATFTNGDFINATGDSFPRTPGSWTSAPGSTSSSESVKTPTGSDNLIAGIIDVSPTVFKNNKKLYGKIENPGKINTNETDNNILMIYNKVPTSYKYTSASVSIAKNSYYKLEINIKTQDLSGDDSYGVYAYVNGSAFAQFEKVDTQGEWKTYTTYIQSSLIEDKSITVTLSLGIGNKETGHMTKGYAFFDDITLTNLTDVKEGEKAFTLADYNAVKVDTSTAKYSMQLADAEFDYASSMTSTPYSSAQYTGVAGYGSGNDALSSTAYVEKGIFDTAVTKSVSLGDSTTKVDLKAWDNSNVGRILAIQNKKMTAYGYRGSVAMRFAADKYYAVSLYVNTTILDGKGATLKLTNGTKTDENNITIDDINTSGAWQKYTFFVQGNKKRNNDLYLEMWLGQGGESDKTTHSQGIAMFDSASYAEITETEYNAGASKFTLATTNVVVESDLSIFSDTTYDETIPNGRTTFATTANSISVKNTLPSAFAFSNVTKSTDKATKDEIISGNAIKIAPNSFYMLSVIFKTDIKDKDKGINISISSINPEKKKYNEALTSLSSFTALNTKNLEDFVISNDYCEASFFISGAEYKETLIAVQVQLGSGLGSQSAGHVLGNLDISSISLERISATEFTNAKTGTLVKTASLMGKGAESEISSNGNFNFIDAAATAKLYPKNSAKPSDATDDNLWTVDGKLKTKLGVPSNWTITNENSIKTGSSQAGILDTNSATLTQKLGLGNLDNFFDGLVGVDTTKNPNVLAISPVNSTSIGYTSTSISMSANSYYTFSVWAKSTENFSIELAKSAGDGEENSKFYNITPVDGGWHQYFIYAQTGIASVSAKLSLYAGTPKAVTNAAEGWVYFANVRYTASDETTFTVGSTSTSANDLALSWLVDSFDTSSKASSLASPSNFTGGLVDTSASSDSAILKAGIFDRTVGDWGEININPDDQVGNGSKLADALFNDRKIGNSVLTIYNKEATAYKYSSGATSLLADTYYKISISVLTYGLKDDQSATITLKMNNQTYTFGKQIKTGSSELDKKRVINTSTYADGKEVVGAWRDYNFYVKTDKAVTPSVVLSVGLGFNGKDNWMTGYVFADNFAVNKITDKEFIARTPQEGVETPDETLIADDAVPTNHRIIFTESDAKADADKNEEVEPPKKDTSLMWLWISSGVVGAFIVIAVIAVLIKKYYKPKKRKLVKANKKTAPKNDQRDKFDK